MRITFILSQGIEDPSAVGRHYPLAKELARLGHRVNVIALHPALDTVTQRRVTRDGVTIHFVGQMHVYKEGSRKRYFSAPRLLQVTLSAMLNIARRARAIPTDVYHLCKAQPVNGAGVVLAKTLRDKALFIDCDDYEAEINLYSGKWQKPIVRFFENNLPRLARGLTVNTQFTLSRNVALGFPAERIVYIPNGIDRDRFGEINVRRVNALREQLHLTGKKVILYIGSMSLFNHPVDLLVRAFADIRQAVPTARLLLVGGGEDYDTLRQQVRELGLDDAVLFVGKVAPTEVQHYLALADLTVDPVKDDLMARARSPLKLVESLAVGTPVVTSDVGDRRDVLAGAGILVPPGDATALRDSIIGALCDDDKMNVLRQTARQVREHYYWHVLVRDFVKVYDL